MQERRKIHTSFHDLSPREFMYFPKGSLEVGNPGKFSRIEVTHLFISLSVLTIVFSLLITGNNVISGVINGFKLNILPYGIALSFLGILTAFFVHELSHKFMAQRYGLWSEYRMFPKGLRLALIFGIFTPLVIAAPGTIMFRGEPRNFEIGHIAVAGPLANIIIAGITYFLYRFIFFELNIVGVFIGFISLVNALLATFNLIPYGPLDGFKVIRWNGIIWSILFSISIIFLVSNIPIPDVITTFLSS